MAKTLEELEHNACLYWPSHLIEVVAETNLVPILLKTQDTFLSILKASDKEPYAWLNTLKHSSTLSPNLFLKHLMILTDVGSERLQRISKDFDKIFPQKQMSFIWKGQAYVHHFAKQRSSWTNKTLFVDKSLLFKEVELNSDMIDVVMLLLWAGNALHHQHIPQEIIERCVIGSLLGQSEALEKFVKQRYIFVSKITGGSTANDLGHACEAYTRNFLTTQLGKKVELQGHSLENISHNDKDLTSFDIVLKHKESQLAFAIEISFQVTTNSVIERKAALAQPRQKLLHQYGHKVIYVIDESGNFQ
ncbi:MAG: hypothetical protein R2880_09140 [Deinococcales bacterium]